MLLKKVIVFDALETNAYFYIDEETKHGWLIDAGAEAEKLLEIIKERGWIIEAILLTHGHVDHIGAVEKISAELKIDYMIHLEGKKYLENPAFNLSPFFGKSIILSKAKYFKNGDILSLNANPEIKLQVIHTPGHTLDSVIFYDKENNVAFVGDTIFKSGIGNTTFPGGDEKTIFESIRSKILNLPENTTLYPGHMEQTTVGIEKPRF